MLTRVLMTCAAGLMMMGAATTVSQARVVLPQAVPMPPASSEMRLGRNTLAPFAHVRFCQVNRSQCAVRGAAERVELTADRWQQLRRVNASVNRSIRPRHDRRAGAIGDHWAISPAYGDCEDYALTKRAHLLRMGWPSYALLIATADVRGFGHHAVLVVRTSSGDYVLDNLTGQIKPWRSTGYRWDKMQSPTNPRHWLQV
ncbi:MAG: transglutaminase-like cysteine peptidase [Pseudomonadota bacterium]